MTKKWYQYFASLMLLSISVSTLASWQVVPPESAIPHDPFFQAGIQQQKYLATTYYGSERYPNRFSRGNHAVPLYAVSISGSLKQNLERIMDRYHWRVVWKAPYDYNFDGRVTGTSLNNVIAKLLAPFPLKAQMYMSTRTLVVTASDNS